jgi:hypothetical protein
MLQKQGTQAKQFSLKPAQQYRPMLAVTSQPESHVQNVCKDPALVTELLDVCKRAWESK